MNSGWGTDPTRKVTYGANMADVDPNIDKDGFQTRMNFYMERIHG